MRSVEALITKEPPYRLLALDGGGIRGMIAIEVLTEIEHMLQSELGRDDDFVLADYFDYIGGTSTGAIIATGLSLGMRVDRIRQFYVDHGRSMFDKASVWRRLRYKFEGRKLTEHIQREVGVETTLGNPRLKTLLMMVMRNASTNSPWPVSNNPRAYYNRRDRPGSPSSNLDLKLWQLVRASTAAPIYFPPEIIDIDTESETGPMQYVRKGHVFVDGGLTVFNNPAFQLFLMATAEPYNLNWSPGQKNMLLVSIGTGRDPNANANLMPNDMNVFYHAGNAPAALSSAAMQEQDFLCRVFGDCRHGDDVLDREVGDMCGVGIGGVPKMFTYMRHNAELSRDGLDQLGLHHIEPSQVRQLDSVEHMEALQDVGRAVAQQIQCEHFRDFLG